MEFLEANLPPSWKISPISEVAEVNPRLDKRSLNDDLEVSFVSMPSVEAETGVIDVSNTRRFAEVKKGYTGFMEGDVLFAKITPCMENGKMALVPALKNNLGFGSTEFHVFRAGQDLEKKFLYYYVSSKQVRFDAEHNMTGAVGQKRVPTNYISGYQIPVPPLEQQKLIVTKIEELFSELDSGIASLKKAQEQLKIYRQALLKHAFEGKLTEQWRKENTDQLETPEQLLSRIQSERETRYQQQLNDWKQAVKDWEAKDKEGRRPQRPIKPKDHERLSNDELINLSGLPSDWCWVRIGDIAIIGTGVTPLKSNLLFYKDGEIPWVTSGALNQSFITKASDHITVKAFNETSLRLYPKHTLVVAMYGEGRTRGKCSELLIEATTNQAIAAIVLEGSSAVLRGFLKWFLTKNYEEMRLTASGGVQPNLNLGIIERMAIPLCTTAEAEILSLLLDEKFSQIDKVDAEITEQLDKAEALRQSILNKAFLGKLVPQETSDEPASELLKRIKAEK